MSNRVLVPGSYDHLLVIDSLKKTLESGDLNGMMESNYKRILDYVQKSYDDNNFADDDYDIEDPDIRPFGR